MSRSGIGRPYRSAVIALLAVSAAVFIGSSAQQVVTASSRTTQVEQAQAFKNFWDVVAGENPRIISSEVSLARDLRVQLGTPDPGAASLPSGAEEFSAASNTKYGGTTRAIGEDPFTNDGCYECGHLTSQFKAQLLLVKQGRVEAVKAQRSAAVETGFHPLVAVPLSGALLCIPVIGIGLVDQRRRDRILRQRMMDVAPRQMEQIRTVDQLLSRPLPVGFTGHRELEKLRQLRTSLDNEVRQIANPAPGGNRDRAREFQEEIQATLASLTESMQIDHDVAEELNLPHRPPAPQD